MGDEMVLISTAELEDLKTDLRERIAALPPGKVRAEVRMWYSRLLRLDSNPYAVPPGREV